jgi:signal transduction histidine kinase
VNGDEQKSRLLDKIAKQTFRASEIVNSLLNFSRTSSTEFEELELNRVIRETLTLLEPQMEKAAITLDARLADGLPLVRGNPGRLQQVFLNLFLNARDAMDRGGHLTVRSRQEGDGVQVEVQDNGPGIPPELISRIFDPFFTTKAVKKGTGLGLSVTYGIVEEHGGRIEAVRHEGTGALFRLEFPAARKAVNAGQPL